jgi:protein TonB
LSTSIKNIKIPEKVAMIKDEPVATEQGPPSVSAGVVGGVPGGVAGGQVGGVLGGVLGAAPVAVPKIATPQRVRVSQGVSQGLLIHKVMPEYPETARAARIQGVVVLHAQISKEGKIEQLQAVSGPAMLQPAAIQAVSQWRYKPYVLNGQPVEVDTVISVNFKLSGSEA